MKTTKKELLAMIDALARAMEGLERQIDEAKKRIKVLESVVCECDTTSDTAAKYNLLPF